MAASGAGVSSVCFSPLRHRGIYRTTTGSFEPRPRVSVSASSTAEQSVPSSTEQKSATRTRNVSGNVTVEKKSEAQTTAKRYEDSAAESDVERLSLKDYFQQSKDMVRLNDGGPPSLVFTLGVRVSIKRLSSVALFTWIFDTWCLHIPVADRTPFTELVKLVERTVRLENHRSPNRPIYLLGESVGACLALAVAAHSTDIDLVLILSNPATCFSKSQLQPLIPFLEIMPEQLHHSVPYVFSSMTGIPLRMVMTIMEKGLPLQQTLGELSQGVITLSSYLSVLADVLTGDTLLWKLQMVRSAAAYANSRLYAVKAQALVLSSGKDQLLPSDEEGERLRRILKKCEIRKFGDSGHALLLEDGVDLVTIIKGASFYRRAMFLDYASDYLPPTPSEFEKIYDSCRWFVMATAPVMLSTLENGKIARGLVGIPSKGPVLFIGYHNLLGLEVIPLISRFWIERKILVRGIAHPMLFARLRDDGSLPDVSTFDAVRIMGAVPVSATIFYKLLSSKSHVLLYPGGVREALHRKGEQYKLFWPERSEFVRMAARFGATIIPFGAIGEDDFGQVFLDYDDQMKIPYFKAGIENRKGDAVILRADIDEEVGKQDPHLPLIVPKFPGRYYFFFGKPIETEARKLELRNREKAHELYLEVKSEVERCMGYLKEKREHDPYRSIIPRFVYQSMHGFDSEVPTFEL